MLLLDYLPPFIGNTKEVKTIMNIEQVEIDNLFAYVKEILMNMFVLHSNKYGVTRYEKIVGIVPRLSISLEQRKLDILSIYNEIPPYTYEKLQDILASIVGKDGFKLSLDIPNFILNILLKRDKIVYLDTVNEMLERIVPINIIFKISIDYNVWEDVKSFTWGYVKKATWQELAEDEEFNSVKWDD